MINNFNFRSFTIAIAVFIFLPLFLVAQTDEIKILQQKLDSILMLQKEMHKEQKNNPLENKKYGIEINPINLLFLPMTNTFTGTFSLFNVDRKAEIAFPLAISYHSSSDYNKFTLDCHYRYFLGNTQNGFYLSAFTRFATLSGRIGDDYFYSPSIEYKKGNATKLGLGFGLGYRKFSYKGWYWGVSLSLGRYLVGENNKFSHSFLELISEDSETIVDMELLKFGYAF